MEKVRSNQTVNNGREAALREHRAPRMQAEPVVKAVANLITRKRRLHAVRSNELTDNRGSLHEVLNTN